MTLPSNIIFPELQSDNVSNYSKELSFTLQRMYEQIAENINGELRADYSDGRQLWKPVLDGSSISGTFTYVHQSGWSLRRGLIIDCWFDVQWGASGTAAGNLYLILPYKVAVSNNMSFVGVVQPSNITYTGGTEIVINAISDTYRGEFWNTGSAFVSANQAVVASGRLMGHIRYVGQQDEI